MFTPNLIKIQSAVWALRLATDAQTDRRTDGRTRDKTSVTFPKCSQFGTGNTTRWQAIQMCSQFSLITRDAMHYPALYVIYVMVCAIRLAEVYHLLTSLMFITDKLRV